MRKAILMLAAVLSLSATIPTYAATMNNTEKDECLLVSKNCRNSVDDIQTQMARISNEINKGNSVYTAQELKRLQQKLEEIQAFVSEMDKK